MEKSEMIKKRIKAIVCMMLVIVMTCIVSTGCSLGYTSSEPCAYCNNIPTKRIASKTENTEAYYYCEKCSTTCFLCGQKAVTHTTNLFGIEMFCCKEHAE